MSQPAHQRLIHVIERVGLHLVLIPFPGVRPLVGHLLVDRPHDHFLRVLHVPADVPCRLLINDELVKLGRVVLDQDRRNVPLGGVAGRSVGHQQILGRHEAGEHVARILEKQGAGSVEHHVELGLLNPSVPALVRPKRRVRVLAHRPAILNPLLTRAVLGFNADATRRLGHQVVKGAAGPFEDAAAQTPIHICPIALPRVPQLPGVVRGIAVNQTVHGSPLFRAFGVGVDQPLNEILNRFGARHSAGWNRAPLAECCGSGG